ncbi:MAG: mannosyltransferase family protein [Desulfotomaculaceae bacterium]|nr:mannosyltransferase family protein [Desulfotomaculaceae bacterium]
MLKKDLKSVGCLYALNKIYIVFLVWLARDILYPILPAATDGLHPNVVLDSLIHWDAGWFLRIAGQGYDFDSAPFFPMFPWLIRLFKIITGDGAVAGFLISNTALLIACCFLYLMVKEDYGEKIANTTIFVMLFFPTAIFFTSIYSEAVLLAFALASIYFARRGNWLPAVLMGACAALTRNIGVVLFVALLYRQYQSTNYRINLKKALPLLAIPASLIIFMFTLWVETGDPLAFAHSLNREYWGYRHFAYPGAGQLLNLSLFFYNNNFYSLFESSMAIIFLFIVIISFKYLKDKSQLIFLVLAFLIPFSSVVDNVPLGMPRYILVLFPGYITIALLLHKYNLNQVYSVISIFSFSVISVMFVAGRWIS